jgi:hypothetical protein
MVETFLQFLFSYGGVTAIVVGAVLVVAFWFFSKGYRLRIDLGPR